MLRFIHHNYAPNHTPLKNPRSKPIRSRNFRLTRYNDFLFFERTVFSVSSESSATIGTSKCVFRLYSFGERRSFLRPLLVSTTETNCYHSTSKPFPPPEVLTVTKITLNFRHIYRPPAATKTSTLSRPSVAEWQFISRVSPRRALAPNDTTVQLLVHA